MSFEPSWRATCVSDEGSPDSRPFVKQMRPKGLYPSRRIRVILWLHMDEMIGHASYPTRNSLPVGHGKSGLAAAGRSPGLAGKAVTDRRGLSKGHVGIPLPELVECDLVCCDANGVTAPHVHRQRMPWFGRTMEMIDARLLLPYLRAAMTMP